MAGVAARPGRTRLAVDTLSRLPWAGRMQAYSDFDVAISEWRMARRERLNGDWQWRLSIRRAIRAWRHYKRAVRAAQGMRIAA